MNLKKVYSTRVAGVINRFKFKKSYLHMYTDFPRHTPSPQAVTIHQNIELYVGYFDKGSSLVYTLNNLHGWLQLIKGEIQLNEQLVCAGMVY